MKIGKKFAEKNHCRGVRCVLQRSSGLLIHCNISVSGGKVVTRDMSEWRSSWVSTDHLLHLLCQQYQEEPGPAALHQGGGGDQYQSLHSKASQFI